MKPSKGGYVIFKGNNIEDFIKSKGIIEIVKANKILKGIKMEPVFHIWPIIWPLENIEESVKYL